MIYTTFYFSQSLGYIYTGMFSFETAKQILHFTIGVADLSLIGQAYVTWLLPDMTQTCFNDTENNNMET